MCAFNMRSILQGRQLYSMIRWQLRNAAKDARVYPQQHARSRKGILLLGFVGVGVGALIGAGYSYRNSKKAQVQILNSGGSLPLLNSLPDVATSREVIFATDNTGLKLKLFQYATCPFCCKVRAFLDYYGLSYDIVEVNPVLRQQISWSQYKKVPIVTIEVEDKYQQLNDSSMIISVLMSYLADRNANLREIVKFYPAMAYIEDGKEKTEILNRYFLMLQDKDIDEKTKDLLQLERKWRKWADDVLVHVLSPNVYRTREEAVDTFNWFSQAGNWENYFSLWERYLIIYIGAYAMWIISKHLKKRHNLKDDVRQSFYDECDVWIKALKKQGTRFMGGDSPNLADLAVFGVLSSVEGSQAFQDVLKETKIGEWYWDIKSCVKGHEGSILKTR